MSDLRSTTVDINSIFQDPANARTHSDAQLQYLAKSLQRFGQQKPIVVGADKIIIAGNGTHLAARDILGWDKISVIYSELPTEEARAYGIADNQIGVQSDWDADILSKHIQDLAEWNPLQDWASVGFEQEFIDNRGEEMEEKEPSPLNEFLDIQNERTDKPVMGKPIKVTEEQRSIINQTVKIVRMQEEDPDMSEGRIVELIFADYISGLVASHPSNNSQT